MMNSNEIVTTENAERCVNSRGDQDVRLAGLMGCGD